MSQYRLLISRNPDGGSSHNFDYLGARLANLKDRTMTDALQLVIGNKNYSSWSLRPWLLMRRFGIPFEETHVNLKTADRQDQILKHSAGGTVPILKADGLVIGDSLAISEYLADSYPDKSMWPRDRQARAMARLASAEMHSGFVPLRAHCPMDMVKEQPLAIVPEDVIANVERIVTIWREARTTYGADGEFLFGEFSIADAMYAPVASRFRTYFNDLSEYGDDGIAQTYVDAIHTMPEMTQWIEEGRAEMEQYGV